MKTTFLILIAMQLILVSCKNSKQRSDIEIQNNRFESIKALVKAKTDNDEIPSLSVAVAENGKIIWMESFGYADKENKIKATPNTLYTIASISKTLTATGIMKLFDDGKINLNIDVKAYLDTLNLKYFTNDGIKVTCRNLLTHTGGLPMYFDYYYDDDTINIPPIEQVITNFGAVVSTPSVKHNYANLGYGILGLIISNITKKEFNEYMKKEIFQPLGMYQTTADISSKTKSELAKRYDSNGELQPFSFADTPGSANFSSSANDLIHFGMFHLCNYTNDETLLKKNTIKLMQQKQFPDTLISDIGSDFKDRNTYGLGWFVNDNDYKYKIIYHAGGMDGVDAMLKLVPEKNIAVVVLVNQFSMNPSLSEQICDSILHIMLPDFKSIKKVAAKTNIKNETKIIKQEDLTGMWKGNIETYNQKIPIKLEFQAEGDIYVYTNAQYITGILSNKENIQHKMLFNKWFFNNGHFMGSYPLSIPGKHLFKCPDSETWLDLNYKNGKLIGTAVARSNSNRMYYGISYYLELEREN
jgi:CubicO group peptidase (beta-lactamase class C family)